MSGMVETSLPETRTENNIPSSGYEMSLIWDFLLDLLKKRVNLMFGVLAWKKVLFLAKVDAILRTPGLSQRTDRAAVSVTLIIAFLMTLKLPFCNMVMLKFALRLMVYFLLLWLTIRRLRGRVADRDLLVNLVCNILTTLLLD